MTENFIQKVELGSVIGNYPSVNYYIEYNYELEDFHMNLIKCNGLKPTGTDRSLFQHFLMPSEWK